MPLWVGTGGIEVEGKVLQGRQVLSVYRWYGKRRIAVADCYSVKQLRQHVDLAYLVEVYEFRRTRRHRAAT
jgi:hypothetical protein